MVLGLAWVVAITVRADAQNPSADAAVRPAAAFTDSTAAGLSGPSGSRSPA